MTWLIISAIVQLEQRKRDKRNEEKLASEKYTEIESKLQDGKNAAVLVSVSKVDELRKAYPSYFLDTKEFTGNIDKICKNCLDWNLLSN